MAHAELDAALAALDQRRLVEHKDEARRSYRLALTVAQSATDRQRAATTWLRRIDDLNRASRGAIGQVLMLRARCNDLDQAVRDTSLASSVQRVRTEAAEAACTAARQRLAEVDRWSADPAALVSVPATWAASALGESDWPTDGTPDDPAQADADAIESGIDASVTATLDGGSSTAGPVAIELVLAGDAAAMRALAQQMADLTGRQPSRCVLLLQVLSETIIDSAIDHVHLRFDRSHPLWAQLSVDEARALTRALRDLGFRYDPSDGWYGDRAPQGRDLALALAYSGIEAYTLRNLPNNEELAKLPQSISVAPLEHLAVEAPDLGLNDVHRLAGSHAQDLADLWDHWADVRALLLAPAEVAIEA